MSALSELLPQTGAAVVARRAASVDWRLLQEALASIKLEIDDVALRQSAVLDLLVQAVHAGYAAWISLDGDGRPTVDPEYLGPSVASKAPRAAAVEQARSAAPSAVPTAASWHTEWSVVASATSRPHGRLALVAIVPTSVPAAAVGAALQLVVLSLADEAVGAASPAQTENTSIAAATLELTVRLADARDSKSAAKLLCDLIHRQVRAEHVAVGLVKRSGTTVDATALSDVADLDLQSDAAQLLGNCLTESLPQTPLVAWSRTAGFKPFGLGHWQELADSWQVPELTAVRFADRKADAVAVCLIASSTSLNAEAEQFLQLVGQIAGPMLRMLERASHGRRLHEIREQIPKWFTGRRAYALAALVALPLVFPWCTRTNCPVVLEPIAHRVVAAPFEGIFDRSLALPGDRVQAGQVLGRMDGRELRARLAACEADLGRAGKSRDMNLAGGKLAGAQIDRLEMERLEHEREVLQRKLEQLEIRSPIAGVVVSGDLRRYTAATLRVGQDLYEIAPLDQLTVEIAVAEEDLEQVAEQADVDVHLDAVADRTYEGRIERIRPRGELRDNRQVFVAEFALANAEETLRPGMKGTATVVGPRAPGAWLLLRKPWYAATRFLGW